MPKMTFDEWMSKVDHLILSAIGLSYLDLSDCPYRDWYDDGLTPSRAAKKAIKNSME